MSKSVDSFNLYKVSEAILANPLMACIVVDEHGIIRFINQAYLEWLHKDKDEVMGKHILEVTPHSKLPEVLRSGKSDLVDLWSVNDRETIITRYPLLKDEQVIGAVGQTIFLDKAGAKILMKKLQTMEKEYETVSEVLVQSPYLIYVIVDKAGIITFMNQTYLHLLGMKKEDVVGKHILEITPHSKLPEVLRTGDIHKIDIWTVNGRDTIITRTPIIKDGEITGAVGRSLFLDMSQAKMLINKLQETAKELNYYREEFRQLYQARWQFDDLIGVNPEFTMVKAMAQQLAHTRSTILITGESGTGKELLAQSIHNQGGQEGPFVRVNCAALPENLLESELFGYEEGAFTGAKKGGKPGKFELAKGGTIFLDEIGDMPIGMQTKLLSVLQERVIERVGGTTPIAIKVRVIAASNRDLEKMVAQQEFREDLYYRLNVVRLHIPPLRERMEDIPLLVSYLMAGINTHLNANVTHISNEALHMLQNYNWPGNVRELQNLLERAINLASLKQATRLGVQHFPSLTGEALPPAVNENEHSTLNDSVQRLEKELIEQMLKSTNYNKSQTAKELGLNKSVLYSKMRKYGLFN
ncbi:sigma 54-interacting transcriptional regulator [Syntrophomonas wolfei]|jgi:transcriptional regulator with PAS, ATPase and Fis domain|uniref:AAA family ATPase n=1 Tax=Syntrophomonas wolfei TaxID=863 RepID=A0A354YWD0_9FIRM|nr:sigma 54-interacting transcriptional regulator [Syntrophomonas wolfei]HBK52557.1 AAA family ATPase [Syntrophomonas wolfei]